MVQAICTQKLATHYQEPTKIEKVVKNKEYKMQINLSEVIDEVLNLKH